MPPGLDEIIETFGGAAGFTGPSAGTARWGRTRFERASSNDNADPPFGTRKHKRLGGSFVASAASSLANGAGEYGGAEDTTGKKIGEDEVRGERQEVRGQKSETRVPKPHS
jgi:hypothetical protein